jgi:transcriptional regulator with XRE-family HTH domain
VTEGRRLEQFVRSRWGRKEGGIRGLAVAVETSADTIYHWFSGQNPPDVYQLGKLARALDVRRWQIVAAMDGDEEIVPLDERTRRAIREEVQAAVAEAQGQRGSPRARSGAA